MEKSYSRIRAILRWKILEIFYVYERKKFFSPRYLDLIFSKQVLFDAVLSELSFGSTATWLASHFFLKN